MKLLNFSRKTNIILLTIIFALTVIYSYALAHKRYVNFEYGKFDLGNMAQMVWNTSQGRFMEVTDQFGTNMPRWGMSHIDPILALMAPFYWVYPHPMLIVFLQHLVILSAIFPIFALIKRKTGSTISSYLIVFAYILYPANGFTLVWTGFHGISFVAPILVWLIWFLERNNFLVGAKTGKMIVYWVLVALMLIGKEEIGAILALASIFLFFKNRSLAIKTFIIGFVWTLLCFLVFIPYYSHYRSESVDTLFDRTGIKGIAEAENVSGENFFINRYAYLGDTYFEIAKNAVLRPNLIYEKTFTKDKLEALNQLFGPFGYIVVISPFWLVSLPDVAIVLLSEEEIFDISNHRIAFMVIGMFVSLIYLFQFFKYLLHKKYPGFKFQNAFFVALSTSILFLNIYFSERTNNPLYITGKSLVETKIIGKVFAKEFAEIDENSKVPRNYNLCLNQMVQIIEDEDPKIYTGPDYLGAHSSLREVNALFPSRTWDADLIIADVFENKTLGVFGDKGWIFNKEAMRRMTSLGEYKHLYSCGKVSAFIRGENSDKVEFINESEIQDIKTIEVKTEVISMNFKLINLPKTISKSNPDAIEIASAIVDGPFKDKVTYWEFREKGDEDNTLKFVDYLSFSYEESLDKADNGQYVKETIYPQLQTLPAGEYEVYWGMGDLLRATDIYLGTINITD